MRFNNLISIEGSRCPWLYISVEITALDAHWLHSSFGKKDRIDGIIFQINLTASIGTVMDALSGPSVWIVYSVVCLIATTTPLMFTPWSSKDTRWPTASTFFPFPMIPSILVFFDWMILFNHWQGGVYYILGGYVKNIILFGWRKKEDFSPSLNMKKINAL